MVIIMYNALLKPYRWLVVMLLIEFIFTDFDRWRYPQLLTFSSIFCRTEKLGLAQGPSISCSAVMEFEHATFKAVIQTS